MIDETVPPAPPRPPFTSPYGMFPDVDAARDALAAEAAQRGNVIDPHAVPFDPTKPTIDQTRSNAIDSIRNNFAALGTAAAIDPTQYLKKTGDTATDLAIAHPSAASTFVLNPKAGQVGQVLWEQAAVVKFAMYSAPDSSYWGMQATPDTGGAFNVFLIRRADGASLLNGNLRIGDNFPRTSTGAPINLDIYNAAKPATFVMQYNDGTALRLTATNAGNYIDSLYAGTGAAVDPAIGARTLYMRTQDASGTVQNRLTFDPAGGLLAGVAAFVGNYAWLGGPSTFALDFHTVQTAGVQAGSTISGVTMMAGQVARIFVNGSGGVTLPAGVHIPVAGATFGTTATIVSLLALDASGNNIFATFVPF